MKYGIFIGRFNPPHLGHLSIIEQAIQENDKVLLIIGSDKSTHSPKKLLNTEQVQHIIRDGVSDSSKIIFASVRDNLYSDSDWVLDVRKQINISTNTGERSFKEYTLYGFSKDQTSQYLKWFPFYKTKEAQPYYGFDGQVINATDLRNKTYECFRNSHGKGHVFEELMLQSVEPYMGMDMYDSFMQQIAWDNYETLEWITEEYLKYAAYKSAWKTAPFPPVFVTGDAVVFCNGCVLVIRRKFSPGKGCYALPGGFINQNETVRKCILRELAEETKIDVPPGKLDNSLKEIVLFDAPGRSLRGRTITNAGLIVLDEQKLPKVKGSDDADGAEWLPLERLPQLEDRFFEDHYHIVMSLTRFLK